MGDCPFCDIIRGDAPAPPRFEVGLVAAIFEPIDPVVPGHTLVVPLVHVEHAAAGPMTAADAMNRAALYARDIGGDCNLITSVGPAATQTVRHLHIHVIPRRKGDGLALPWTGQHPADTEEVQQLATELAEERTAHQDTLRQLEQARDVAQQARRDIAADIFADEQKCQAAIAADPTNPWMAGRLAGLQRARDIAEAATTTKEDDADE